MQGPEGTYRRIIVCNYRADGVVTDVANGLLSYEQMEEAVARALGG